MPVTAISPLHDCLPASHQTVNICRVCLTWMQTVAFRHLLYHDNTSCYRWIKSMCCQHNWFYIHFFAALNSTDNFINDMFWKAIQCKAGMIQFRYNVFPYSRHNGHWKEIFFSILYTSLHGLEKNEKTCYGNSFLPECFINKHFLHWIGYSMEYEVEGSRPRGRDQRGRGKRLCRKIVKHVIWTRRMLWIVVDGRRW